MERVQRFLRELGLTEYEARVYTALVSAGSSSAGELSGLAGVPYSRIYDIMSRLERRGWVEIQPGRPARYRAKPPAEVLERIKIEWERKFKETSEIIIKELEPVYERIAELKRPDIWVIRGERSLLTKIGEMLTRAQVEVLITVSTTKLIEFKTFAPILSAKNLKIRLLTDEKSIIDLELPALEARYRKPLFGGGVIIDGREVLLLLTSGEEKLGIWSDEVGLAKFAKEYFEYLWKDSSILKRAFRSRRQDTLIKKDVR
ncbi:MAG: TrmB family transcriptional regulator [Candidatus Hadarchaeum sp.]